MADTKTLKLSLLLVAIATLVLGKTPNTSQNAIHSNDTNDPNQICLAHYIKFNVNHTACVKPNPSCKIKIRGVDQQDRHMIIDEHNRWRNHLASGNESHRGFPSSADMLQFQWDDELAYVAQKHAEQCEFEHDCYDCRKTTHYSVVGQNLYIYRTTRQRADSQWDTVIKEWYDEIKIAPADVWKSFDLHGLNIGHFTQIAWSKTNRVGCGYTSYENTHPESADDAIFKTIQLYTCNYAPGGNYLNEPLYASGNAASQCPAGTTPSKAYPALCEYGNNNTVRTTATTTNKKKKKKSKKTRKSKKKTIKRKKITTVTTRLRTSFGDGTNLTNTTITRTIVSPRGGGGGAANKTTTSTTSDTFWLTSYTRRTSNNNRATSLNRNTFSPFSWTNNNNNNRTLPKRTSNRSTSTPPTSTTPWWKSYATQSTPIWKFPDFKKGNRTARSYVMFEMSHNGTTTQRYRNLL